MKIVLKILFVSHFCIILIYLIGDLYKIESMQKLTYPYTNPLFEQYWGMFSEPPISTRKIFFQYQTTYPNGEIVISDWYDINEAMYRANKKSFFSIAQRLIKYQSSCINSILLGMINCAGRNEMACVENTEGYKSLKKYANVIYRKKINKEEKINVLFKLKILENFFPDFEHRNLDFNNEENHYFKHYTSEFRPIN